jgi:hypothetical protein
MVHSALRHDTPDVSGTRERGAGPGVRSMDDARRFAANVASPAGPHFERARPGSADRDSGPCGCDRVPRSRTSCAWPVGSLGVRAACGVRCGEPRIRVPASGRHASVCVGEAAIRARPRSVGACGSRPRRCRLRRERHRPRRARSSTTDCRRCRRAAPWWKRAPARAATRRNAPARRAPRTGPWRPGSAGAARWPTARPRLLRQLADDRHAVPPRRHARGRAAASPGGRRRVILRSPATSAALTRPAAGSAVGAHVDELKQ